MLETPGSRGPQFSQPAPPVVFPKSPGAGPQDPGEFTRMLESPFAAKGLAGDPLASAQPRPTPVFDPPAGEAAPPSGPSEFTKMFKTPAAAPEPVEKPVKKPAGRIAIPRKKKKNTAMWIWIGIAVLIALGLLLYFALSG
jgi:hypothetical protein